MLNINVAIKNLTDEINEIENETKGSEGEFLKTINYKERLIEYKKILINALNLLENPQWYKGIELIKKEV